MQETMTRRRFETLLGAAGLTAAFPWRNIAAEEKEKEKDAAPVSFFFVSDTHFLAEGEDPSRLDERSEPANARLIETLNRLPGTAFPDAMGGGTIPKPRGVIHGGDLIDSGDKNGALAVAMQKTEWKAFRESFGLDGTDGKLKYPVYEVYGNHDGPRGTGLVIDGIIERNTRRPGLTNVSKNGLHYSWNWGPVHFVNLGIVVGTSSDLPRKRRYDPRDSHEFLKADLAAHVGDSGRPVVITHHIDILRYSHGCDETAPPQGQEWDACDVAAYHGLIKDRNVVALLFGHTHARDIAKWNGGSKRSATGLDLFNVDESSHFRSEAHGLLHFEFTADRMIVREFATKDNWKTGAWTNVWNYPIKIPANA